MAQAAPGLARLRAGHRGGSLPVVQLAERRDDIAMIEDRAAYHRARADLVCVLGAGGASMGGQTLYRLTDAGFGPDEGSPRLVFFDNIDPHTFDHLFRSADLTRTDFILISKSGGTAEILAQALICLEALAEQEDAARLSEHFTVITEPRETPLSRLAQRFGMTQLPHDLDIGGRYSALSLVGLLPAAIAGLDPVAVREGAQSVVTSLLTDDCCAPAVGAALQVGLAKECGIAASVLMPYCDRLGTLGFWYRQLWAESLGKGGKGTLPVRALGTVDQLYLDGPRDKFFTLIETPVAGTGRPMQPAAVGESEALDYLQRRTMGDLMDAMQRATAETLIRNGCPTRVIGLERVDEGTVGALMMHFIAETIIAADMLGVDAFDQPAVEQGKVLARQYMAAIPARD